MGKGKGPKGSRQRSNSFTISYGPKILIENWPFIDDVGDDDDDDAQLALSLGISSSTVQITNNNKSLGRLFVVGHGRPQAGHDMP